MYFRGVLQGCDEVTLEFLRSTLGENIMPKLTINLKGVGICYYMAPFFKVLFPFNPDHRIKFAFKPMGQPTEIELAKEKRTVRIEASKADPFFTPPVFSEYIDLTKHVEAHDEIEKVLDWDKNGILLTINDGQFAPSSLSDCRYGLELKGGSETKRPVKIRFEGTVIIDDPRISIVIDPPLTGFPDPIIYDRDGEITFDNTCPKCPTKDDSFDFNLIYSVIKDTTTTRQFAMKRYFWDKPFFLAKLLEVVVWGLSSKKKALFGMSPLTNPPRFAVGLPCNINVATKPEKLP
jgi:hypothetical protein